jgi:DUF1365 family protein
VTASALYEGTVRHRRFVDGPREFTHRLALAYVDLDELPELVGGRLVRSRPGFVRFRGADYLAGGDPEAIRRMATELTGSRPLGPIRILTQLRSFGHCFNPVSFVYCFDSGGERIHSVLAEVTNTPWGERHVYALPGNGAITNGHSEKVLHVSPFMGMDHRYDWRVATPDRTLSVHIESASPQGQKAFDATLNMQRRPLDRRSLATLTARYPLANVRVLALIYAHALKLKLRGTTVHPHPEAST